MNEDHEERISNLEERVARLEAELALVSWQMERLAANFEGLLLHTRIGQMEILEILKEGRQKLQKGPSGTPLGGCEV